MTEPRESVPPAAGSQVDAVVPPADGFEAWPVPDPAPDAGGMVRFAAVVLGLTGIWHVLAGLMALARPEYFRTATARLPSQVDDTAWGWLHLLIGLLAVVAAFGVVAGNRLASVVAVVLAVVSAVVNLVFIEAEPVGAFLMIALDVLVIWGVTAQAPPPRPAP